MSPKYPSSETSQQISIPHQKLPLRSEHVRPNKFFKPSANQKVQRMESKINIYVSPFDPVCLSQLIIFMQMSLQQLEMLDTQSLNLSLGLTPSELNELSDSHLADQTA